jgi:hypothetical protein
MDSSWFDLLCKVGCVVVIIVVVLAFTVGILLGKLACS